MSVKKTLRECAVEALSIYTAEEEAAYYDAGFDAGEFSGPAHAVRADQKVEQLAVENGFTLDQVNTELMVWTSGEDVDPEMEEVLEEQFEVCCSATNEWPEDHCENCGSSAGPFACGGLCESCMAFYCSKMAGVPYEV